ncbi:purine-binding chemotaxis protein CheW [Silvimonas terrae]|uniref:Purine-binding chemotaxis protein CheW n=1 Tax=Silvimonas terrae TaxID=300266 RepID=A0A840RGB7_9NEIS|nr:chemotaxis protein CheW [Silvimonas terrae]MBB5191624.1 purine-binding chemotaxis protein CheW [Silvimonas terrae]
MTSRTGSTAAAADAVQYLTFSLDGELFAVPIEHIREIIEFGGLTAVPLTPQFLRGVINLRGAVVPVVDLGARFGRSGTTIGRRTCIVILEVEAAERMLPVGILVDTVNEVLTTDRSQIEPRPPFGARIRADFMSGMLSQGERFVIVLDVGQVLSVEEMGGLIGLAVEEHAA